MLLEVTTTGSLVQMIDISAAKAAAEAAFAGKFKPAGLAYAPGSQNQNVKNIYIVDRHVDNSANPTPIDGGVYEMTLPGGSGDTPPSVTVTNPNEGATVFGTINVTANASDDNGVTQVEFFVDGNSIGVDTTDPYDISWDTTAVTDGSHTVMAEATDTIGQKGSNASNVTVDNINDPPVANFTFSCTDLACNFDASGSSDLDGNITTYAWDFGDTSSGSGMTANYTYATAGTYTVVLTVTDNGEAMDTDTQNVPVALDMHVGDLGGSNAPAGGGRWNATVVITVHDDNDNPVANASVSGSWSAGANGSGSCTTDAAGTCSITKNNVKSNVSSVTFTVDTVSHATFTYQASDNHDPDGDSDGTSIVVFKGGAPPNNPPEAVDDPASTLEDSSMTVDVLANDTDPEADPLSIGSFDAVSANGGTVTLNDDQLSYTPPADFNGSDSFTYTANDGTSNSAAATVTVTVSAVNDEPSFTSGGNITVAENSGAYSAPWATNISMGPANEAAQTGTFIVTANTNPGLFSVAPTIDAAGALTFTPAADQTGSADITVKFQDNGGVANGGDDTSAAVTFTITVYAVTEVTITGADPNSASTGTTIDVMTIDGSGFAAGANVTFENGSGKVPTAIVTTVAPDGNSLEATVTVPNGGNLNDPIWDVRVTNPDGSTGIHFDLFTVTR
jgi:PKD repeat protein